MRHLLPLVLCISIAQWSAAQNVGIGTVSPSERLHIKDGNLLLEDDYSLMLNPQLSDTAGIRFLTGGMPFGALLYSASAHTLNMSGNDTVPGLHVDFNTNRVLIGRSQQIDALEKFGISVPVSGSMFGGMYVEATTPTSARPFYGFAINGTNRARFYFDGFDARLKFQVGGTRMVIDSASGYVGIAQFNPQERLHVMNKVRIEDPAAPELQFYKGAVLAGTLRSVGFNTTLESHLAGGSLFFRTDSTDRMYVVSDGRVVINEKLGIGLPMPVDKLHIAGDMRLDGLVRSIHFYNGLTHYSSIEQNGSSLGLGPLQPTGKLFLRTQNLPRLTIDENGKVGIGTTSPTSLLDVAGAVKFDSLAVGVPIPLDRLHVQNGIRLEGIQPHLNLFQSGAPVAIFSQNGNDTYLTNVQAGNLFLRTSGTTRMTIDDSGNVGIGTTTPMAKLEVSGTIRLNDAFTPQLALYTSGVFSGFIDNSSNNLRISNKLSGEIRLITSDLTRLSVANDGDVTMDGSTFVLDANNNRVGIGIAPADRFHVNGNVRIDNVAPTLNLFSGAVNAGQLRSTSLSTYLYSLPVGGSLHFGTANQDRMVINGSGFVGINEPTPQAELHVGGDIMLTDPASARVLFLTNGLVDGAIKGENKMLTIDNSNGAGNGLLLKAGSTSVKINNNGAIECDNTTLVVDAATNRVGLGTNMPLYGVDMNTSEERAVDIINTYSGSAAKYGIRSELSSAGTGTRYGVAGIAVANPTAAVSTYGMYAQASATAGNSTLYGIYAATSTGGAGTKYAVYASAPTSQEAAWSVWGSGNAHFTGDVRIGHTTDVPGYLLSVDGKIISEEVKVQLSQNWPDYVFSQEYDLMTLAETKQFIAAHGHLPNIPSSKDVTTANGVELGEMNRLLLEKVEELTLHVIRLQEEVDALRANGNK